MENLKIEVKSKEESAEAQGLLFELGYHWAFKNIGKDFLYDDKDVFLFAIGCGDILTGSEENRDYFKEHHAKEVTINQLKDMVVLKRNDVGDATHIRGDGKEYFQTYDKERHYHFQDDCWVLSTWMNYQLLPQLKPIKKEVVMKEYLNKLVDGTYELIVLESGDGIDGLIEVPEGAFYYKENLKFYNGDQSKFYSVEAYWKESQGSKSFKNLWQRETQQEELPSTDEISRQCSVMTATGNCLDILAKFQGYRKRNDGETDQSYREGLLMFASGQEETLNDKVASAEVARQEVIADQQESVLIDHESTPFDTQISGDHYKLLPIQPMKFALANGLDYAQGNVIKYVVRHASKGGKEDLLKAIHNIELMIQHYYGDQ